MKEYEFRIIEPGIRWKVVHNFKEGPITRVVYFVRFHPGNEKLTCTCSAFRFGKGKPCKHTKFVANLIGRPELVEEPAPF